MPSWAEEPLDPLWMLGSSVNDYPLDIPALDSTVSTIHHLHANNTDSPFACANDFPSTIDPLLSSESTMIQVPSQITAPYEQPVQQRQRALPRRRSKYVLRRTSSKSRPMAIPNHGVSTHLFGSQSLAIQRWQNSPPEDEAASLSAICNALDSRSHVLSPQHSRSSSRDAFRRYRGPSSTTSIESAASESSLRSWKSGYSAASPGEHRTHTPRQRGKARTRGKHTNETGRIFKCTFCCDTFKHKYDWARHEKSLHLNMEEWICTPKGGSVLLPSTGRVHCAYCNALDPTAEHLEKHNHSACLEDRSAPRVFRRKDHLVQHLRLFHGLDILPLIDEWKMESMPVKSRCGFCSLALSSWSERTDHLAAHYREGKTMAEWHGDHEFEPVVAARVTKAFPPWLIASQSTTLVPFSATNPAALDHTNQLLARIELEATREKDIAPALDAIVPLAESNMQPLATQQEVDTATFADILSSHLSRFARQQMLMGVLPTDEMFQRESRRLLYYDGDDKWNQTVADDPTWLHEFKQRSGFDERSGV